MTNEPQYIIEGIILRRLHEKRIEGYTIETAKEIADSLALRSEVHTREALANQLEDWAFWGELDNYLKDDFLDDIERIYAGAAQAVAKPGPDERPIPSYGQIPWDQLGRDVMDAMYARRNNYAFDPSYYPGHQMLPPLNFNSLARIVDKYRYYGASAVPSARSPAQEAVDCDDVAAVICASAGNGFLQDCHPRTQASYKIWARDLLAAFDISQKASSVPSAEGK